MKVKRLLAIVLTLCMILGTTAFSALAEETNTTISSLEDFVAFRDAVNGGNTYAGQTVTLAADIDLSTIADWIPIGNGERNGSGYTGNAFSGVFDGGDRTISNLTISSGTSSEAIGLFGVVDGGTVKNLTLTDVNINASSNKNAGAAIGLMVGGATADSITVSGLVSAADGVGGVIGRMTISGTVSNCVNSANVSGAAAGGIVGKAYYTGEGVEMNISNCTNSGTITGTASGGAGGIVGFSATNISGCTNNGTITSCANGVNLGGIVGWQQMYGEISDNTNNGSVTSDHVVTTAGGIVGWANYQYKTDGTAPEYPNYEVISVTGNTNNSSIVAANSSLGSGGIVGGAYNAVSVTGNTNYADTITGSAFAAGILGNYQNNDANGYNGDAKTLTVTDNTTYTKIENISANCTNVVCYDNVFYSTNDYTLTNTVVTETPVAEVGGVKYTSAAEALLAAANTGAAEVKFLTSVKELLTTDLDVILKADMTITADSAVTVDFYNNGTTYDLLLGGTNGEDLTIAENVTLTVSDRIIWIGYHGNNIDVIVNGSLIGGSQLWFGGDVTISETGTVGSKGEALVGRRDAKLTVNGGTLEANYFSLISGTVELNNATATTGPLWLSSNSEGAGSIILNNSNLTSTGNLKMSGGASVTVTGGSALSVTGGEFGASVIGEGCALTIDTSSSVTTNAITGTGAISIDASDFNGTAAPVLNTAGMSGFTGNVSVVNSSNADFEIGDDGKITIIEKEVVNVVEVNGVGFATLTEAAAAAQAGDEIVVLADVTEDVTVPAGVIFNGNGKQVGAITAAGEITFKGHTKATSFGTQYTNTTINIGVGACLEITGTGRLVIGHGCTFNIEGNIVDAKTANVAELTPSLIMPGASFTGAGVTFNVKNAYIKTTASYCSSSKSASGTFDFNIENSIWEQFGKFAMEAQSENATCDFNLIDSVMTTTSHLVFGLTGGNVVIDNSVVNEGVYRQLENRGNMTIKNGSVVYASVATSSNAKNPGTTIVDNATYKTTGEFSGSDLGTGTLIVKNGAKFSTGKITKANITIDAEGLIAGEIDMVDADLSSFAGELSVINNTLGAKIENGKIVLVAAPVAKIGDVEYTSLQEALDAAATGTGNVTVDIISDIDLTGVDWKPVTVSAPGYPVVTVNGNDKTITGLNDMLFAGTWAGGSGLIINDLTIKDSAIVNDKDDTKGTVGVGAFIGFPQASATVTLNNCNLVDSSVEGGHWTGGLIGYAAGYAGNDGPVFMNLTINNCSVTGSTITGKGSAGGIIGHATGNAWTQVTITNTTVSDNAITSTGSSTNKAGAVMGTIGAAGQETTVNGETKTGGVSVSATVSDNTVTSNGTAITTIYGRQGTETGNLVVSGGTYEHYPIEENVSYANPADGYEIVENTDGTYGVAEAPSGTLSCAYTSATGYWGECGGNAKERFEFKFYNDNTYMGYTSLNNVGGIIDGSVYVSWSIKLDAASNTDPYWTMEWEVAPTIAMQPNRVEQWVDGVKVAECAVQPNWSDNIFPVVAAVTDADGKILSYVNNHEDATLANALANGETVTVLENIDLDGTTVTIPAGVDAILDLNGKTISDVCNVGQGHMIMVTHGANLTIKDSSTEKEGKITYASGTSNVGWVIDVEGNLVLESGTIELTGSWNIGYAVDVRPNAWGTAYTEPTTFVMNGGNIVSSDGAVRVASSSSETYPDVAASFTMNDGKIDAAWDGIFVQQSNAAWDTLSLTINGGTIESDLNPVRFYGPAATSYVNSEDCVDIKLNGGTLTYTGTEEQTWMVEGILRIGGGVTAEDFMKDATVTASASFAQSNVAEGYKWVESNDVYTLEKAEETANPFKDAPLFLAGLPDETVDGVTYHPVYMATSIDSLNYRKVGFDYIFQIFDPETGETTFEAPYTTETSEVYNSISDANTTYTVDSIGGNGEYLFMNKLLFDSEYYHNDNTKITITPYAIDMNGNKITGWTIDMTNEYYKELQSGAVKQDMFKEAN